MVLFPVCLVLFLNGASYLLQDSTPSWAMRLNPFNINARVNYIVEKLGENPDKSQLDNLLTNAQKTIWFAPGDARGYSATAEVFSRTGNTEKAEQLIQKALKIGPTEINALLRRLDTAMRNNDVKEVALRIDIILRRWPLNIEKILPVIVAMTQDIQSLPEISKLMTANPPWRYEVVKRLVTTTSGLAFVQKLLLEQHAKKQPLNVLEQRLTITSLLNAGNFTQAYSMFILTLDEEARESMGYVFNSAFKPLKSTPVFGWKISKRPGAEVTMIQNQDTLGGQGLRIQFFDKPARLGNVRQLINLPPGTYKLQTQANTTRLQVPKELFWQISCTRGTVRGLLAKLNIEAGTYRAKINSTVFSIPGSGCPLQLLMLKTGINSESWIDRYQGNVTFKHVTIQSAQ